MTTRLHCPKCGEQFNHDSSNAGKTGGGIGGAIAGAVIGAKFGIVGGPIGAIAGTIPGAILGGLGLGKLGKQLVDDPRCPKCGQRFSL